MTEDARAAGRAGCVPAGPGDDGDVRLLCGAGADDAEAVGFVPYSPLGHGFLTCTVRSASQLREGDVRTTMPRFADGNLQQSLCLVEEVEAVEAVAKDAGATPAQVTLAWLLAQGDDLAPLPGARHVARLEENLAADRLELIAAQLARLTTIAPAVGTRYPEQFTPEVGR